ncbi:MAG TPA: hypothetical protein VEX88_11830 [Glaciibacter sp.]|nr:hypothetical protein [Glaciibacter sp.]
MTNDSNGAGIEFEDTIPVEDWETAEWPAAEPLSTSDTRPGLRWRRTLVVLTSADADTNMAGD